MFILTLHVVPREVSEMYISYLCELVCSVFLFRCCNIFLFLVKKNENRIPKIQTVKGTKTNSLPIHVGLFLQNLMKLKSAIK